MGQINTKVVNYWEWVEYLPFELLVQFGSISFSFRSQTLHVMVYQQESEISQSHAMTLLTEYTSLYLSNIIYSSHTSISDRANEHVVYIYVTRRE